MSEVYLNLHFKGAKGSLEKKELSTANSRHAFRNIMPAARKLAVDREEQGEVKGHRLELLKLAYLLTTPDVGG